MIRPLSKSWSQISRSRAALALVAVSLPLMVLLGWATDHFGAMAAFGFLAIPFGLVLFAAGSRRPFLILVAVILAAFSVDYLVWVLGLPGFVTWIQPLMIGFLFVLALLSTRNRKRLRLSLSPVIGTLCALFAIIMLSAFINGTAPAAALSSLKNYFAYPLLFLAVVLLDLPEESQQRIRNLILGLILVQIPIAILQRYSFLPGAARGSGLEDLSGGTLGVNATGILSLLCLGVAGITLTLIVFDRLRLGYLVTAVLVMAGPIVSEGKVVVFLLPVVVLVVLGLQARYSSTGRISRLFAAVFTAAALLYGIVYLMPILAPSTTLTDLLSSPETLRLYMTRVGGDPLLASFGRFTDLGVTVELLERSTQSLLFGFGPGTMSRTGQAFAADLAFSGYLAKAIGGIQATALLLESGFLGAIAYLTLLLALAGGMLMVPRRALDPSALLQITSFAVALALYLIGLFYTQPWWSPALSVSFWAFAGITWTKVGKLGVRSEGAFT